MLISLETITHYIPYVIVGDESVHDTHRIQTGGHRNKSGRARCSFALYKIVGLGLFLFCFVFHDRV